MLKALNPGPFTDKGTFEFIEHWAFLLWTPELKLKCLVSKLIVPPVLSSAFVPVGSGKHIISSISFVIASSSASSWPEFISEHSCDWYWLYFSINAIPVKWRSEIYCMLLDWRSCLFCCPKLVKNEHSLGALTSSEVLVLISGYLFFIGAINGYSSLFRWVIAF